MATTPASAVLYLHKLVIALVIASLGLVTAVPPTVLFAGEPTEAFICASASLSAPSVPSCDVSLVSTALDPEGAYLRNAPRMNK